MPLRSNASIVSLALGVLLGACSGGDGGSGDGGEDPPDAGMLPFDAGSADPLFGDPVNLISLRETEIRLGKGFRTVVASAELAGTETSVLVETARAGSCRLLESEASYCENCDGFCVAGECRASPTFRSAGRIQLEGLSAPLALAWNGFRYDPDPLDPPDDVFHDTARITASAPGDWLESFTVSAYGVAAIDPELDGPCRGALIRPEEGDTVLTWPAPESGARVRLWMPSATNAHGLPPNAVVECEGPDTGELRVPRALADEIPGFSGVDGICKGVACVGRDCPPSTLRRYTQGEAVVGDETVALRVQSEVQFYVATP